MRQLFDDLLSTIFFLVTYLLSGDIFVATGIALAAGVAQMSYLKLRGSRINAMRWASLALVIVLGGATILTRNGQFIMVKPSITHFAIGAVMLRRGWMGRYLPRIVRDNLSEAIIVATGYAWAALMIALGLTNLVTAWAFDAQIWVWFISVGAIGAKLALAGFQFLLFRTLVRRRLRLRTA